MPIINTDHNTQAHKPNIDIPKFNKSPFIKLTTPETIHIKQLIPMHIENIIGPRSLIFSTPYDIQIVLPLL